MGSEMLEHNEIEGEKNKELTPEQQTLQTTANEFGLSLRDFFSKLNKITPPVCEKDRVHLHGLLNTHFEAFTRYLSKIQRQRLPSEQNKLTPWHKTTDLFKPQTVQALVTPFKNYLLGVKPSLLGAAVSQPVTPQAIEDLITKINEDITARIQIEQHENTYCINTKDLLVQAKRYLDKIDFSEALQFSNATAKFQEKLNTEHDTRIKPLEYQRELLEKGLKESTFLTQDEIKLIKSTIEEINTLIKKIKQEINTLQNAFPKDEMTSLKHQQPAQIDKTQQLELYNKISECLLKLSPEDTKTQTCPEIKKITPKPVRLAQISEAPFIITSKQAFSDNFQMRDKVAQEYKIQFAPLDLSEVEKSDYLIKPCIDTFEQLKTQWDGLFNECTDLIKKTTLQPEESSQLETKFQELRETNKAAEKLRTQISERQQFLSGTDATENRLSTLQQEFISQITSLMHDLTQIAFADHKESKEEIYNTFRGAFEEFKDYLKNAQRPLTPKEKQGLKKLLKYDYYFNQSNVQNFEQYCTTLINGEELTKEKPTDSMISTYFAENFEGDLKELAAPLESLHNAIFIMSNALERLKSIPVKKAIAKAIELGEIKRNHDSIINTEVEMRLTPLKKALDELKREHAKLPQSVSLSEVGNTLDAVNQFITLVENQKDTYRTRFKQTSPDFDKPSFIKNVSDKILNTLKIAPDMTPYGAEDREGIQASYLSKINYFDTATQELNNKINTTQQLVTKRYQEEKSKLCNLLKNHLQQAKAAVDLYPEKRKSTIKFEDIERFLKEMAGTNENLGHFDSTFNKHKEKLEQHILDVQAHLKEKYQSHINNGAELNHNYKTPAPNLCKNNPFSEELAVAEGCCINNYKSFLEQFDTLDQKCGSDLKSWENEVEREMVAFDKAAQLRMSLCNNYHEYQNRKQSDTYLTACKIQARITQEFKRILCERKKKDSANLAKDAQDFMNAIDENTDNPYAALETKDDFATKAFLNQIDKERLFKLYSIHKDFSTLNNEFINADLMKISPYQFQGEPSKSHTNKPNIFYCTPSNHGGLEYRINSHRQEISAKQLRGLGINQADFFESLNPEKQTDSYYKEIRNDSQIKLLNFAAAKKHVEAIDSCYKNKLVAKVSQTIHNPEHMEDFSDGKRPEFIQWLRRNVLKPLESLRQKIKNIFSGRENNANTFFITPLSTITEKQMVILGNEAFNSLS